MLYPCYPWSDLLFSSHLYTCFSVHFILHTNVFLPSPHSFLARSWPELLVLFLACLPFSFSLCYRTQEISPQYTVLISSRQTWAKKVQPGSPDPCPACYSYTVHAVTPETWRFMGKGWKMCVRQNERPTDHMAKEEKNRKRKDNS